MTTLNTSEISRLERLRSPRPAASSPARSSRRYQAVLPFFLTYGIECFLQLAPKNDLAIRPTNEQPLEW